MCTFGSTVKSSQLTGFDHYSYLPLKCSCSRGLKGVYTFGIYFLKNVLDVKLLRIPNILLHHFCMTCCNFFFKHEMYIHVVCITKMKIDESCDSFSTCCALRGVSWPSGLVHWTQVLVLSECGFESRPGISISPNVQTFVWEVCPHP